MSIIVNHTTTTTTSSSSLTDSKLDLTEKSTASESTLQLFPESPSHHKLRQTMAEQAILEDCDLRKIISETTVQQLLEATTLNRQTGHKSPLVPVCLDSHLTVQEGCAALAYHKISSAPIYDQALGGFVGMLDYKDLVAYVLEVFKKLPKDKVGTAAAASNGLGLTAEMEVSDIVKLALSNHQGVAIKFVSNISKANPLIPCYTSATLNVVAKDLVKHHAHRVVVMEELKGGTEGDNKFVGVLSQSALAAFVVSKAGRLVFPRPPAGTWPTGDKTVHDLGLVRGGVVCVKPNDMVLDALDLMHEKKVSSVAIVETTQTGSTKLTGNISMTDMKEIFASCGAWKKLYDQCQIFFNSIRLQQGIENAGSDRMPSFLIHPNTTLIQAMEKMAATRSHRLWVVDSGERLVGIVSLSDCMPFIAFD